MPGIDESLTFHPLNVAVLTISDTRDEVTDTSGALLRERLVAAGHMLADHGIVKDDIAAIRARVTKWIDDPAVDIVITTGGTGLSPRDVTPEAIRPLFRREIDGFSVVFHQVSFGTVGVGTLQSRAFAGQAGDTFVFCLPGSTGACRDGWDHILAFELDSRYRPCSIVAHVARLHRVAA
jgi:molybdenum cofactor biosynthesis protein B